MGNGKYRWFYKRTRYTDEVNFSGIKDFLYSIEAILIETSAEPGNACITLGFRLGAVGDGRWNYDGEYRGNSSITSGYKIWFNNAGFYRFSMINGEGDWTVIQDWTSSEAINLKPGIPNIFTVQAIGPEITIYANDQEVTTFSDSKFTEGGISFGIGIKDKFGNYFEGEGSPTLTVEFDNLIVKAFTSE